MSKHTPEQLVAELLAACKPLLSDVARSELNSLCEAMEDAADTPEDRTSAAGLRVLLDGDNRRREAIAKAEGRS